MTRRRAFALVAALTVAAALTALVVLWRPWDPVPDELRAAVRQASDVPGVVSAEVTGYEVTLRDAKDGDVARASVGVELDDGLVPEAASAAAAQADDALAAAQVDGVRTLSRTTTVHAGAPRTVHGVEVYPLTASVTEDGDATAVADAFVLWRAGATRVSGPSADAPDRDGLVRLAQTAAEQEIAASLRTADGTVQYDTSGRVPDAPVAQLAVEAAARPGVASVSVGAQVPEGVVVSGGVVLALQVHLAVPSTSPETDALTRWLDDPRRTADDVPLAYTLWEPGYATSLAGWVAGSEPPAPQEHTVPLPADVAPWPDDDAPACTGDDLRLSLGTPDAAAGSRYLAVQAENVSGGPCALEGVPGLEFRNADGEAQPDVTLEPSAPGVVPGRVVVPAGERSLATVQWRAMSTTNDPDVTTTVAVVPVPGADPVPLTPTSPDTGDTAGLDVLDGAEVRVGPWVQRAEGWS
ncbi:DUF4232 domain-containing protein [Krasilnikoviella flava]|uniref:DUF4232 domain-containing protein n=1 Tax=Krasilnikoviella flava TaxID=526729 RepID=A0A1T5INL1_9MICO|nr:DUF4232 domain-containing protein [Krasilnikoviella flava]SKC40642.1 Protein of unknown function [Krasilnikoviella flava]